MRPNRKQGWKALSGAGGALALAALFAAGAAAQGTSTPSASDKVKLRSQLGIIYAQNGQVEDAKKEFVRLLEEPTGRPAALTNLGNIAMLEGKVDVALENYTQAAALDTADGGILFHLSAVKGPVLDRLERSHFLQELTGKVHLSHFDAISSIKPDLAQSVMQSARGAAPATPADAAGPR